MTQPKTVTFGSSMRVVKITCTHPHGLLNSNFRKQFKNR